jgi:hypothetical protein
MDAIQSLSRMLAQVNQTPMPPPAPQLAAFAATHQQIQARLGRRLGAAVRRGRSADMIERMRRAVLACRDGAALDIRDLRLACAGCALTFEPGGYVLLDDRPALWRLLSQVEKQKGHPRGFARLYGQLLRAYFGEADSGSRNHLRREPLRVFLAGHRSAALATVSRPSWARALADHPGLTEAKPEAPFVDSLLAGAFSDFEAVAESLGLMGESWLSHAVVVAAAELATKAVDRTFKAHLRDILNIISYKRFTGLRDDILARLIERYAQCETREDHPALRDRAVAAWRNPWLPLNAAAWGRVSEPARQMVIGWLKLNFVSEFFNRLAEGGQGDPARFEFWRRYLDQIEDMYFLLGRDMSDSSDPDIRALRARLEGRLLGLTSTDGALDAFVMITRNAVIVEFGLNNNATYAYGRDATPFTLEGRSRISTRVLKQREKAVVRLNHQPRWQSRFETELMRHFSLSPDSATRRPPPTETPIGAQAQPNPFDEAAFRDLVRREQLEPQDYRDKGGNLWVRNERLKAGVLNQLRAWGFRYKAGSGWYLSAEATRR